MEVLVLQEDGQEMNMTNSLKVSSQISSISFNSRKIYLNFHFPYSNASFRQRLEESRSPYRFEMRSSNSKPCIKVFQQNWERLRGRRLSLHLKEGPWDIRETSLKWDFRFNRDPSWF